jgi:hypothetical protein
MSLGCSPDGGTSAADQHDSPHRSAACPLDAGKQLRPSWQSAAAVVAHALEDVADQHVALPRRVRLGEHPLLAAAVAGDPH